MLLLLAMATELVSAVVLARLRPQSPWRLEDDDGRHRYKEREYSTTPCMYGDTSSGVSWWQRAGDDNDNDNDDADADADAMVMIMARGFLFFFSRA